MADTGAAVHAFEPDPVAFETLSKTVGARSNVVLHNAAVGVGAGEVPLYRIESFLDDPISRTQNSSTIASKRRASATDRVLVPQIDFVDFLRSLGFHVALVKMDIEGAEVEVLRKVVETGTHEKIGKIFVETHEKQIPELRRKTRELIRLTRKAGNISCDWW